MDHRDVAQVTAESAAARRLALIASFGARALEQGFDLDALLAEAAAHATAGLVVERAKVLQHRPEAGDLLVRAGVGWKPGVVGRATLPADEASPPGRCFSTGESIALEDVRVAEGFEWSALLRGHGVVSLLDVPVRLPGGRVWGVLEADAETPRRFSREHRHFLISLAGLLGAAIRRLEAEAALRESEGRLRALADNLPSGMVYQVATRRDGSGRRFLYVSGSCERLTGVPAEAALADPAALYAAIAPEHRPALAAAEAAALRDLAPFEFEARLVRAGDGEVRWCHLASAPREMPDGSLVWDGLLVDVTERRAAEAALHGSEALKAAILEAALDCVVTIDQESRVIDWNPAAEHTFGHARAAALGADMAELIVPPELREAHRSGLARYLATGEGPVLGRRIEVEALRAGGSRFPAELAITPTSVDGRTLFTAHLRDITRRRAAEAALAESEARFHAIADNIPQLAWMAEPDGRRIWFNRRWHDYTGLTPEEAQGWGWARVHHPEFLERVLAGMKRAWTAGEPWEDTFPLRGRDGDYRWFLTRAVPVRDGQGRPVHWFGTNTDVTDQPM